MEFFGNSGSGGSHLPEDKKPGSRPGKAPREKKKGRAGRRALTVIGVIALVVIAAIIGYTIWEKPPEIGGGNIPSAESTPKPSANADPDATPAPDGETDEYDFDGALTTERSDGVYTLLLVGRDHESNSTDTIIVGKFDTVNHTIDAINIPRDTLANISWSSTPKKINAVYPGYTNSGKSGIDGLKTHIKNLIGFDVDCYAVVNLKVVEDVINEIGGVYFDVPIDMDYDDGGQHFHVHLKQGYQQLNGYEALGVFRYRYGNNGGTYPGGDLQRIGVQQDLLKSIASQMLSLGNIPNLTNVIQLLVDNVETDLTAANMAFFARQFLKCSMSDINFHTAPYSNTCLLNGISYVSLDVDAWLEMVNDFVNPFKEPVTTANVNILTSNGTGSYITSTTGAVAGGIDSFYCMTCHSHHAPGPCPTASSPEATDAPESTETPSGSDTEAPAATEAPSGENSGGSADTPTGDSSGESSGPEIETVVVG